MERKDVGGVPAVELGAGLEAADGQRRTRPNAVQPAGDAVDFGDDTIVIAGAQFHQ